MSINYFDCVRQKVYFGLSCRFSFVFIILRLFSLKYITLMIVAGYKLTEVAVFHQKAYI